MPDHVLGHLVRRFTISEENLATEALTWIPRDPSANSALCSLVRGAGTALPDGLTFIWQVGNLETGRPDIVGLDVKADRAPAHRGEVRSGTHGEAARWLLEPAAGR